MATNGTQEPSEPLEFPAFEEPQVLTCPFCREEVTAGGENLRIVTIVSEAGWKGIRVRLNSALVVTANVSMVS